MTGIIVGLVFIAVVLAAVYLPGWLHARYKLRGDTPSGTVSLINVEPTTPGITFAPDPAQEGALTPDFVAAVFGHGHIVRQVQQQENRQPVDKTRCQLHVEQGKFFLYMPDGTRIPHQINCTVDQDFEEATQGNPIARVTIELYATLVDTVQVKEDKQIDVTSRHGEETITPG